MNNFFKVFYQSKKKNSKARLGEITTAHGKIKTPSFVAVGTKGTVKALTPDLVKQIKTQVAFVNTYHLVTHPGAEIIKKAGGVHKYSGLNMPLMSDSGGFQVFSLAKSRDSGSKFLSHESLTPQETGSPRKRKNFSPSSPSTTYSLPTTTYQKKANIRGEEEPFLVKISEDGVKFRSTYDGKLIEFTPEKSMEYQRMIGADINMAFDECTYYPATHEYAEKAMKRTHEWLKRCITEVRKRKIGMETGQEDRKRKLDKKNPTSNFQLPNSFPNLFSNFQFLYGIIQGGTFEDLRKKSAKFVVSQNTPGVAIGGVSVGESKKEMRDQVKWVSDYLPKDRPVHLLGVGQIDDIIDLVKYGIDTFDCVEPTRLARMGTIYQLDNYLITNYELRIKQSNNIDILKGIYKNDLSPVDENCNCYVCTNFTKSYLHHLFKQKEILGYTLATYHNLWTMERLFEKIREAISENRI